MAKKQDGDGKKPRRPAKKRGRGKKAPAAPRKARLVKSAAELASEAIHEIKDYLAKVTPGKYGPGEHVPIPELVKHLTPANLRHVYAKLEGHAGKQIERWWKRISKVERKQVVIARDAAKQSPKTRAKQSPKTRARTVPEDLAEGTIIPLRRDIPLADLIGELAQLQRTGRVTLSNTGKAANKPRGKSPGHPASRPKPKSEIQKAVERQEARTRKSEREIGGPYKKRDNLRKFIKPAGETTKTKLTMKDLRDHYASQKPQPKNPTKSPKKPKMNKGGIVQLSSFFRQ